MPAANSRPPTFLALFCLVSSLALTIVVALLDFNESSFRFPSWWYIPAIVGMVSGPSQFVISWLQLRRNGRIIQWFHFLLSVAYLAFFSLAITDSIPFFNYGYHLLFGMPVVLSWLLTYIQFSVLPDTPPDTKPHYDDILDS